MKDMGRLVMGFRHGDVITIGDDIAIMFDKVRPGLWRVKINCPKEIRIKRYAGESVPDKGPKAVKRNPRSMGG